MATRSSGLWMIAGAIVWAVHFGAAYGAIGIICARGLASLTFGGIGLVVWTMGALTVVALAILAIIAWRHARRQEFVDRMAVGIAALSALAVVWEAWLVTRPPACA